MSFTVHILIGYITLLGFKSLLNASPVINTLPRQGGPIRSDYIHAQNVGYHKLHMEHQQWADAQHICNEEGADLAVINSINEADVLGKFLKKSDVWEAYVGISDIRNEGEWVTTHGLPIEKAGFYNWDAAEPNNGGPSGPVENCGVLRNNLKLNDVVCSEYKPFICELNID